jgi:hypothetical protein
VTGRVTGREEGEAARPRGTAPRADAVDGVEFLDAANVHWRVTERDATGDPGARGERCLIFTSDEAVRRVWDYPPGWRDLAADALAALSWRR